MSAFDDSVTPLSWFSPDATMLGAFDSYAAQGPNAVAWVRATDASGFVTVKYAAFFQPPVDLAAVMAATSSSSAALSTSIRFTADLVARSTLSETLTTGIPLSVALASRAAATFSMSTSIALTVTMQSVANQAQNLTTAIRPAVAMSSMAVQSAALTTAVRFDTAMSSRAAFTTTFAANAVTFNADLRSVSSMTQALATAIPLNLGYSLPIWVQAVDSGGLRSLAYQITVNYNLNKSTSAMSADLTAGANNFAATNMASRATTTAALTTAVRFSAALNSVSAQSASLVNWSFQTVSSPYLGAGSLFDSRYWSGPNPKDGDNIAFENRGDGFSIAANGDYSSPVYGNWLVQYFDGTAWNGPISLAIFYSDFQTDQYSRAATVANITTAVRFSTAMVGVSSFTGALGAAAAQFSVSQNSVATLGAALTTAVRFAVTEVSQSSMTANATTAISFGCAMAARSSMAGVIGGGALFSTGMVSTSRVTADATTAITLLVNAISNSQITASLAANPASFGVAMSSRATTTTDLQTAISLGADLFSHATLNAALANGPLFNANLASKSSMVVGLFSQITLSANFVAQSEFDVELSRSIPTMGTYFTSIRQQYRITKIVNPKRLVVALD